MAMFYMRTLEEAMDDGLVCRRPCFHPDCASWVNQTAESCSYCDKPVAGSQCFIEEGRLVHAKCVIEGLEPGPNSLKSLL